MATNISKLGDILSKVINKDVKNAGVAAAAEVPPQPRAPAAINRPRATSSSSCTRFPRRRPQLPGLIPAPAAALWPAAGNPPDAGPQQPPRLAEQVEAASHPSP